SEAPRRSAAGANRTPTTVESIEDEAALRETQGRLVSIEMPNGVAEAYFVTPKEGRHPGVLMWPDVAGLRDAYKEMATRLAQQGYAVLVVNHYYRSTKLPVLGNFVDWQTDEGKKKVAPMRAALTPEGIAQDGATFASWLDRQPEVDTAKKLASAGYCMTGAYTVRTAAAVPERIGAIASFHGTGLIASEPSSPHWLLSEIKAAALFCIAQNDDARDPEAKNKLREAVAAAHITAEIEVYPAQHGWCTLDSPAYDKEQAARAWSRMLTTFQNHL
ncbi:MAG TPA: dienelactone hydrolase family protein, partial [Polyangiaceae bacterium]|nr:dienelactone hydrolase family protein [Polyangiaceae bacterium]